MVNNHQHKYTKIEVTKADGSTVVFELTDEDAEPVFLLRGQDRYAWRAVKYYSEIVHEDGFLELAEHAHDHATDMERWQPKKAPD